MLLALWHAYLLKKSVCTAIQPRLSNNTVLCNFLLNSHNPQVQPPIHNPTHFLKAQGKRSDPRLPCCVSLLQHSLFVPSAVKLLLHSPLPLAFLCFLPLMQNMVIALSSTSGLLVRSCVICISRLSPSPPQLQLECGSVPGTAEVLNKQL